MRGWPFGSAAARMLCPLAAAVVALATVRPAAADDWPMLAHDAGRSGATAEEVKPPVKRAWVRYFHLEGLMPSVQPVVAGDRVYLGTRAGNFYCLGAADGKDAWVRKVGGPVFHTACVTPEGLVVFGAGDGVVYALRSQDGQVAWKFQTAAPLWNSPVAHDRRIYLGGRDGRFYALSAADGVLAWQFDAGAPICQSPALDARRGAVYFTSEDMVVHALGVADESCQLSVTGRYLLNLNNHHGENLNFFDRSDPERGTFGQYYTTHTHWYGVGIVHRLLRGELDRIDAGQEDLIAGLGDLGYATGNHPCANMPVVAAGGRLFYAGSNKLMALAPAQAAPTFSRAEEIADYGIAPLTEAELKTLYDTWPINWDRVRLRPPDGKWDDLKCHTPAEVTYPPGTKANPDEAAARRADAIADDLLDRYVWEWPVPGALPADAAAREMKSQLAAAVKELVAQPVWMPYRFQGGKHPSDTLLFYEDPADMLYALALAYPWLEESLQAAVKAYVARQWSQADPVITLDRYRPDQGAPREFHTVPAGGVEARVFSTGARRRGPERAYAAWLWAQNTGDWEGIRPLWPTLRKAHEWTQASAERDWKNAYTAGLIAACRMAKHFGDAEALEKLLPAARQALRERIALEWRFSRGNLQGRLADTLWTTWTRWVFLSPEVGRAVREQAGEGAVRLARTHLDVIGPFWYLNWGPVAPTGLENATQLPVNVMAGFLAKAYLEGAPAPALRTYADIPACRGDWYWIQRLEIALNACSQPEWRQAR